MKGSFPKAKLARVDQETLAAAFAEAAGGKSVAGRLRAFAAHAEKAPLPTRVAIAAASFPRHGPDGAALLAAAQERLAESRRTGRPVID